MKNIKGIYFFLYIFINSLCASDSELEQEKLMEIKYRAISNVSLEEILEENRKIWHEDGQEKISNIDKDFFPLEETQRQNLCKIRVSIVTTNGRVIHQDFNQFLFVSGKTIYYPKVILGTLEDLDKKRYEVSVQGPSSKTEQFKSQELAQAIRKSTFLKRLDSEAKELTVLSLNDFYIDLEKYRKDLMDFFNLSTFLGHQTFDMTEFFDLKIKEMFSQDHFEFQRKLIKEIYIKSLNYASLTTKSIDFLESKLHIDMDEGKFNVEKNFCDSEQSIRLFLTSSDHEGMKTAKREKDRKKQKLIKQEWLNFRTHLLVDEAKEIASINVDIASRRHMCNTCFGTYEYDLKDGNKTMLSGIFRQLGFDKYNLEEINYSFLISGSIEHKKH